MNYILFLCLLLLYIQGSFGAPFKLSVCDNWIEYKKEKCYYVLNKTGTEDQGHAMCAELDPKSTLINITNAEQQQFLMNYLTNYSNTADRVWTGIYSDAKNNYVLNKYGDYEYKWQVDSKVYTNWADGSPESTDWYQKDRRVQISITRNTFGKWFDESKGRKGLIVCERRQEWTIGVLSTSLQSVTDMLMTMVTQQQDVNAQQNILLEEYKQQMDELSNKMNKVNVGIGSIPQAPQPPQPPQTPQPPQPPQATQPPKPLFIGDDNEEDDKK